MNDDPGPPIYNPMNMPPFSNPEPTPREMPIPAMQIIYKTLI